MSRSIHVIHTVPSLGVSAGGPSRTVPALCAAVATECPGISVEIVTSEQPEYGSNIQAAVPTYTAPAGTGASGQRALLRSRIAEGRKNGAHVLLHDHGQWLSLNRASAAAARAFKLRRVVSPRGMLTPWALRHRAWKKKLAWLAYARRDLFQAAALHATSDQEADDLKLLGAEQRIAVIPNGVEPPDAKIQTSAKKRTVVFLSRLHPKKGVRELVAAWRAISPAGWRLVLAGPDEAQMLSQLRLSSVDNIEYIGEVGGVAKWELLGSASLVVLPSYSENFGVVVAEALMAGTPVIATQGTPWQGLTAHGCGWWIPMEPGPLVETLKSAISLDPAELAFMGNRGKAWVRDEFAWPQIGRLMGNLYESLK